MTVNGACQMGTGVEALGHCPRWWRDGHVFVMHVGQNPFCLRSVSWLVNMVRFTWDTLLGEPFDLGW